MNQPINHSARRPIILALLALHLIGALAWAVPAASAQATSTILVSSALDFADSNPNDTICSTVIGACTLRAAIQTANRRGGTVTIKLQPLVYSLTIKGTNESDGATGDLDVHTNVNIVGASLNGVRSTIDGAGLNDSLIEAMHPQGLGDILLSLDTVILRNGDSRTAGAFGLAVPGAILAHNGASLALNNCEVRDNIGQSLGGAIAVVANLTIRNCFFVGNRATGYEPEVNLGRIDYNGGGAVAVYFGALQVDNSTFRQNTTDGNGGAIWSEGEVVELVNTMVDDNAATRHGGGVYTGTPFATFVNSTLARNTAAAGGGLFVTRQPDADEPDGSGPPPQFIGFGQSVIHANTASSFGGGIHVSVDEAGKPVPIVANGSVFDGNLRTSGTSNNCSAATAFGSGGDVLGSSYNLSSDSSCFFTDPTSKKNTPAKLTGPVKFSTTVRAFVPAAGSPMIDARPLPCTGSDVRGVSRPQNGKCDLGAVEVVPGQTVGTPSLTPDAPTLDADQLFTLTLSWSHPTRWRDLRSVELRLVDDGEQIPVTIRFTEGVTTTSMLPSTVTFTDGLTLLDSSGAEAGAGQPGATAVLASDAVELDLAQSHLQPQGADENTMTLTLALRLKAVVGGKRYRVEMVATNDDGTMQGPEPMGSVTLSDSPGQQPALRIFLPLLRQ